MDLEELIRVGRMQFMQALRRPPAKKPEPSSHATSCEIGGEPSEPRVAYVGYSTHELTHAEDTHPVLMTRYLADCAAFVVFDPVNNVGALAHCPGKSGYDFYERDAERLVSEIARGYQWSDETQIHICGTNHPGSVTDVVENISKEYFEGYPSEKKVAEAGVYLEGPNWGIKEVTLDTRNGLFIRIYGTGDEFQSLLSH